MASRAVPLLQTLLLLYLLLFLLIAVLGGPFLLAAALAVLTLAPGALLTHHAECTVQGVFTTWPQGGWEESRCRAQEGGDVLESEGVG